MSGFITHRNFDLKDTPSLKDKVAVCTGGNAGLGREIVAQLLAHDISKVYVLARSSKKFQDAIASWTERKLGDIESRVEFITCDLGDVTVVKKVAYELMQKLDRLDMLFNHAGEWSSLVYTFRNS
jgi:NAD(P)-dependent dehydrogenase (short-subunit alcohol dehydrogenase family)